MLPNGTNILSLEISLGLIYFRFWFAKSKVSFYWELKKEKINSSESYYIGLRLFPKIWGCDIPNDPPKQNNYSGFLSI